MIFLGICKKIRNVYLYHHILRCTIMRADAYKMGTLINSRAIRSILPDKRKLPT